MERKIKKNSIGMFDAPKGFMMVLIICLHSIYKVEKFCPGFQYPLIFRILSKTSACGLAMLFAISGYFFRTAPLKKSFLQQAKNLLKPYALAGGAVVMVLLIEDCVTGKNLLYGKALSGAISLLLGVTSSGTYGGMRLISIFVFWYIIAMFNSWMLLNLFMKLGGGWKTGTAVGACCLTGMILGRLDIRFLFCIPQSMCCMIFLYAGWLCKKHKILFRDYKLWVYAGCFLLYCVGLLAGDAKIYENIWKLWLLEIPCLLAGVFFAIEVYFFLIGNQHCLLRPFIIIGRYSLWVMCFHGIDYLIFDWEWIFHLNLPSVWMEYALLLVMRGLFVLIGCLFIKLWKMKKGWKMGTFFLSSILFLSGCAISKDSDSGQNVWLPALVEVQEGFHFVLGEDGKTEPLQAENWDNYMLYIDEQGNIPENLKIYFPSDNPHLIMAIDGNENLIGRWEQGAGECVIEVPQKAEVFSISVSEEEEEALRIETEGIRRESLDTPLLGKNVSIIADSVSAYAGYIPEECIPYYSKYDDRNVELEDMWWYRLARNFGMNLCVANASGSSGVTHLEIDGFTEEYYEMRSEYLRTTSEKPDVILSWLGGNDSLQGVTEEVLFQEYCSLVKKMQELYPGADIYLITYYSPPGIGSRWSEAVNTIIRQVAENCGIGVLETVGSGINENTPEYFADMNVETGIGMHPNAEGQRRLGDALTSQLLEKMEDAE